MDFLLVAIVGPAGEARDRVVALAAAWPRVHVTAIPPPRSVDDGVLLGRFDLAVMLPPPGDETRWAAVARGLDPAAVAWVLSPGGKVRGSAFPGAARMDDPGLAGWLAARLALPRARATARREAGSALRPELLLRALDQLFDAVVVTGPRDARGTPILYANRAFERQSGLALADIVGKDPRQLAGVPLPLAGAGRPGEGDDGAVARMLGAVAPVAAGIARLEGREGLSPEVEWQLTPLVGEAGLEGWVGVQQDVSEAARRAAMLERSERRYRSLVDRQFGFVCRCMADGRLTYVNESAGHALRPRGGDPVGSRIQDSFAEPGATEIARLLLGPALGAHEITAKRRPELGGGWIRWRFVPVVEGLAGGETVEWQGFGEDVTDRLLADQRRTMLAEALDRAGDLVGLFDLDGEIRYANRALRRWLGRRLGMPSAAWSVLFVAEGLRERILADLRGPTKAHAEELSLVDADGRTRLVMVRLSRLDDPGDSFLAVMSDVTARRAAEEDIRRLAAFPTFHPEPVLELAGGRCTFANEAAQRVVKDLGLRTAVDLLPPGWEGIAAEALAQGRRVSAGDALVGDRTYGWMFNPLRRAGVVHAFAENLTDRRRLEGAIGWMNRVESMRVLSGGVAHEFNNVLAIISASAEVLELGDGADLRACVKAIHDAVSRGNRVVAQLSDLSQPVRPQRRAVELGELLRSHVAAVRPLLPDSIRVIVEDGTPAGTAWIEGDPGQLGQILMNLTTNARDAMPSGGRLTLRIEAASAADLAAASERFGDGSPPTGTWWCLRVADTGQGIPRANQRSVFDPFYTTKAPGKGTGLGLSVMLNLLRAHGGLVDLQSEEGLGCTFNLFFRAAGAASGAAPDAAVEEDPVGGRVLVVENEPFLRLRLETLLSRSGFEVRSAEDAPRALLECAAFAPEVLLVDHGLPGSTGTTLIADCRALGWKGGAVVMTGSQDPAIAAEVEALGGVAFLPKPFHLHDLVREARAARRAAAT